MTNKTYIYEGKEHVLTGRTATKRLRSDKIKILHEIRPADLDSDKNEFNQWIEMDDLFVVEDLPE
jgi:hypothetical protein